MYSVQEIAKIWNLSDRRVREMCAQGLIPNIQKVGKSYLIPKTAIKPVKKEQPSKPATNEICICCKTNNNLIATSLVYNFFRNEQNVDVNFNILKFDKDMKPNKIDNKTLQTNVEQGVYKCVIIVDSIDKPLLNKIKNTKYIHVSNTPIKNNANKITGIKLPDISTFSSLAIGLFFMEGVLKQIYDIVCNIINDKYSIPITFNFNNQEVSPSLIYELPTIQKSYEFLSKQYDSFDGNDEFFTLTLGNEVEFSDSNQELDYAVKIINALKRDVSANFIYVYNKNNLKTITHHFSTKAYLQNLNKKSAIYMISKNQLDTSVLTALGQGVILYKNEGVYHDKITEYSLGYVNANKSDVEKYQQIINNIILNSTKINNEQQMEEFYELHK